MYMYRERVKFFWRISKKCFSWMCASWFFSDDLWPLSFPLNHNNVVPKLCPDGRVSVAGSIHRTGLQLEGSILKWSHHWASTHPPKVSLARNKIPREMKPNGCHVPQFSLLQLMPYLIWEQSSILSLQMGPKNVVFLLTPCLALSSL